MKRTLFAVFGFLLFIQIAAAQITRKQAVDEVIAKKGANLFIDADKTLLEPRENTRISIKILVYPKPIEGDDTPKLILPTEMDLEPNSASPYKATNWKILQGVGNLIAIDETTETYAAPAAIPITKSALISVDLIPQLPNLPKVVLLQTIYFTENETAFVLNMPALGILGNKYVSKLDTGAKVPGIDPRAAQKLPPAVRKQMEEAAKKMEHQSMEMDLSALTSNTSAIYDKVQLFTTMRFTGLEAEMKQGTRVSSPPEQPVLTFNFNGNALGTYKLEENKTGLGFFFPTRNQGFGCGDQQSTQQDLPCHGTITITSLVGKIMKGTIRTTVFTSVDDKIYRGSLTGKFTARRAN